MKQSLKENIQHEINRRPFSMHRTTINSDQNLALYHHWHDEIEIFLLEKGRLEFWIESEKIELLQGEAIIIPPGLLHAAVNCNHQKCVFFAFVFDPTLLMDSYAGATYSRFVQPLALNNKQQINKIGKSIAWQKDILIYLNKIKAFHEHEEIASWELEVHGLVFLLWNQYYIHHIRRNEPKQEHVKLYDRLSASIHYMQKHYGEIVRIKDIASESMLCVSVFCRYFKKLTDMTPFDYLIRYRIRKGCDLLTQTNHSITHVASLCGFSNISHFNRMFRRYVQSTPREYRKREM